MRSRAALLSWPRSIFLIALVLAWSMLQQSPAAAAGRGPSIGFGPEGGNAVAVVATSDSPVPYKGFNIHLSLAPSAGLADLVVTANADDGALGNTGLGPPLCVLQSLPEAPNDQIFACTVLGFGGSVSPGLLALFTLSASGSGCVEAALVSGAGNLQTDTYTIDAFDSTRQENAVDTESLQRVLIGAGTIYDCPSSPPPPTPTSPPPPLPASAGTGAGAGGGGDTTTTASRDATATPEATEVVPTGTPAAGAALASTPAASATVAVTPLSVRGAGEPVSEVSGSQSGGDSDAGGGDNTMGYLLIGAGVLLLTGLAMRAYLRDRGAF